MLQGLVPSFTLPRRRAWAHGPNSMCLCRIASTHLGLLAPALGKSCSLRAMLPKSSAVYRLAPPQEWGEDGKGAVQLVRCFEGCAADTGFFSVTREKGLGKDSWVVANYTCTVCHSHAPWLYGQMMPSHIFVFRCQ